MKANLRDGAVVNPEPTTRDGFPDSMQHRISIGVNSMLECMSLRILGRRQASGHLGTFCASGCLWRKQHHPETAASARSACCAGLSAKKEVESSANGRVCDVVSTPLLKSRIRLGSGCEELDHWWETKVTKPVLKSQGRKPHPVSKAGQAKLGS